MERTEEPGRGALLREGYTRWEVVKSGNETQTVFRSWKIRGGIFVRYNVLGGPHGLQMCVWN